ncbi:hypothetical protein GUITHDRAFT_134574 [Guillardia theta CCMP2712]|uniref:RRM domain-containing protein n=1 Tax=Guillardia theta (strain CCMP2712) TaxID=905079 RepID=L1JR44_GUITC|nr:hypothetical protein GUITHDRAFT_134574 [Guillardia theta CCMP2712]EKX51036.1 hypothetical protein GUITHDRAFT_134574 [Guillardia theta CCMP2712]|eukprot:XP_005838016.1 hypothetical protein GUITHDRAFT_134574 [Guillardia theta CCMP2712]
MSSEMTIMIPGCMNNVAGGLQNRDSMQGGSEQARNLEDGLTPKQIEAIRAAKAVHAAKTAMAMAKVSVPVVNPLLGLTVIAQLALVTIAGMVKPPQRNRLYVGSLHFDLKEADVRAIFQPFGPIKTIEMSYEPTTGKSKGYAFIEYMNDAQADACEKAMDGFMIAGRPIKVGRPHNTVSANAPVHRRLFFLLNFSSVDLQPWPPSLPQQAALAAQKAQAQPLNTPVAGPPARIYIGSVLFDVKESEVKQIFQVFGSIKQISMIPNPENGKHKGYGFIEYEKHDDAVQAIQAMNGFQLAGRPLKEDKTSNPIIVAAANAIADKVTTSLVTSSSNDITTVEDEENLSVSSVLQRKEIMCKLANRPSRVVLLKNMVEPEDVDPLLEQEIAEECSKFGKVNKVLIVTMVEQGSRLVKVFVEFGDQEAATKAVARLDKRWFGGKIVNASTYEEERFVRQDLSG